MTVSEAELAEESADNIRLYGAKFAHKLALLREYKRKHGHASPPVKHPELGNWVNNLRQTKKSRGAMLLTSERIAALDALGFEWEVHETTFAEKLQLLREYKRTHGHTSPPQNHPQLGTLVLALRQAKKGQGTMRLTPERIAELDALGFVWEPYELAFAENLALLREYQRKHGHASPPFRHPQLGEWVQNLRQAKKGQGKRRLTPERIAALDALGFVWEVRKRKK